MQSNFDAVGFLQKEFTDADGVYNLICKQWRGEPPQRTAIQKWFQRASIPGDWMFVLYIVAQREHGRCDIAEHLREGRNDIFA